MTYQEYVVMAYPFTVTYEDDSITIIRASESSLSELIKLLSVGNLLHSTPKIEPYSTRYNVYVLGDISPILDDLKNLNVTHETKKLREVPNAEYLINEAAYIAIRKQLYKLGFTRGAPSKLFNPGERIYPENEQSIFAIYKAIITGFDRVDDTYHLFLDAARKIEFTKTIRELESMGMIRGNAVEVSWLKVIGTPTSFYVIEDMKVNDLVKSLGDEALKNAQAVIEYLVRAGRIHERFKSIDFNLDDLFEYALIPKSVRLKKELRERGLLLKDPEKKVEGLFLPKSILTPIGSLDNIKRLVSESWSSIIDYLRIPPSKRYEEVQGFMDKLTNKKSEFKIKIGGLSVTIYNEPLVKPGVGRAEPSYLELQHRETEKAPFHWRYDDILRQYKDHVKLYIFCVGRPDQHVKQLLNFMDQLNIEAEFREYPDPESLERDLKNIVEEIKPSNKPYEKTKSPNEPSDKPFKGVIVVGPLNIPRQGDDAFRQKVEYTISSQGVFCRYLSRSDKKESLPHKLRTVLQSFVIFVLGVSSHKLKPLEVVSDRGKELRVDKVVGIDATIIGMEKGVFRVACAVTILDLASGTFKMKPYVYVSDEGEDAAIVNTLKYVINDISSSARAPTLVYVNRARPEKSLLSYLSPHELGSLLETAIIVGATKTHNYSRILKREERSKVVVNPEPWVYIQLYRKMEHAIGNVRFLISRYLMTTVEPPRGLKFSLTVKPVLFTIIWGDRFEKDSLLESKIIRYSTSLVVLNNVSTAWMHSLPWPLHIVDRKLKKVHELAPDRSKILLLLQSENIFKIL